MNEKQKMSFHDRLKVTQDIIVNVKDDFKTLADKEEDIKERVQYLLLASKTCDLAVEVNGLMMSVLTVEEELAKHIEKQR